MREGIFKVLRGKGLIQNRKVPGLLLASASCLYQQAMDGCSRAAYSFMGVMVMIGLALEGGGARGAFHMGVVKAFLEEGYEIGGITGTSIGALNGAIIVQGSFEEGTDMGEPDPI